MNLISKILVVSAFAALVGVGVTAWLCMKLTREEQPDKDILKKRIRLLILFTAVTAVCYLLSLVTGAAV